MAAAALFVIGMFVIGPLGGDRTDGGLAKVTAERSGRTLDDFRGDMANFALTSLRLQHRSDDLPELSTWLAEHGGPMGALDGKVPANAGKGCAVVDWGEAKVSLICFFNEKDEVVHLFVTKRCEVDCAEIETLIAENVEARGLHTKGWVDDEAIYLLVGADPSVKVDSVL